MLQNTFAPIQRAAEEQARQEQELQRAEVAQENSSRLAQYGAEGRATFRDPSTGLVQPKVPDEQWTAEQAAKQQKVDDRAALKDRNATAQAQFKTANRPYFTNAKGEVVPLHPDETWAAIQAGKDDPLKLAEIDKMRAVKNKPMDEQIKALSLDVHENPERQTLRDGERKDLETKLKKGVQAGREALMAGYGQAAKAKAGSWVPFMQGDATPDAVAAQGKLKSLGETMADPMKAGVLGDDESNDLAKVNPALHEEITKTRAALAADDERRTWQKSARQQLFDLKLRRENPAKWEQDHLAALATASPEEARARIGALQQDVLEERAMLEDHATEVADTGARFDQALTSIQQQNAAARQVGIPADRVVTGPDGQAWDAMLLAQAQQAERARSEWAVKIGPRQEALKAGIEAHNARVQRLTEAMAAVTQREEQGRKQAMEKLRGVSPELADLENEREQRLKDVAGRYGEGAAREAAVKAINDDIEQRGQAVRDKLTAKGTSERQSASEVWGELGKAMDRGEDVTLLRQQKTTELAKKLSIDEGKARTMLDDAQKADWVRGDEKELTRVTSDGGLLVKPDLWDDKAKFTAAVKGSKAGDAAKQAALKAFPQLKEEAAKAKIDVLRGYGPFQVWAGKQPDGQSDSALLEGWLASRPKWKAHLDQLMIGAVQGTLGLVQSGAGVAQWAGVEGADKVAAGTSKDLERVGGISSAQPAGQWTAMGANLVTGSLPAMVAGGALARVGILGAEALGVLPRAVSAGQAALAGARAERVAKLINATAFGGTAGVQSFGQTYADAVKGYQEMGYSKAQAEAQATMPALGAGLSTAILTALGADSGAEALTSATAKRTIKEGVKDYLKAVFGGALHEAVLEEVPDQFLQDLIAKATYEPNKTVKEITDDAIQTFFGSAAFGGAMEALHGAHGLAQSMRPQSEVAPVHSRPETVAAAQAAIDGMAVQDVGTLPKQLVAPLKDEGGSMKDEELPVDLEATNARAQGAAFALLDLARGADVTTLPTQDIELLGLERRGDKLVAAKEGTPLVEVTDDGQAIITQGALDWLESTVPEVRQAIGLDERARREQVKGQGASQPSAGTGVASQEVAKTAGSTNTGDHVGDGNKMVGGDHVAGAGKMVAAEEPSTPEGKRTVELTNHLHRTMHLSEEKARAVAEHLVATQGVVGDHYLAQVVAKPFAQELRRLGFTGSLEATKQASDPLTPPVDLAERLQKGQGTRDEGQGAATAGAVDDEIPMGAAARTGGVNEEKGKGSESISAEPRARVESRNAPLLREMRAVAQRVMPERRVQAERTLAAVGRALGERHAVFHDILVGQEARKFLKGKQAAVVMQQGRVTLALDLDRIVSEHAEIKDPTKAARAMVREEVKHALSLHLEAAGDERFTREAKVGYWRALPAELKQAVWQSYRAADISHHGVSESVPAKLSEAEEYALSEEFIRMLSQNEDFGERITETVDPASGLLGKIVAVLKGLADKLREFLKGATGDLKTDLEHVLRQMIQAEQRFAAASRMHEFDQVQNPMTRSAGQVMLMLRNRKAEGFTDEAMVKLHGELPRVLGRAVLEAWGKKSKTNKGDVALAMRSYLTEMVGDGALGRDVAEGLMLARQRGALAGLRTLWNKALAVLGDPIAAARSMPAVTGNQVLRLKARMEALVMASEAGLYASTVKPVNLADLAARAVGEYEAWWSEELARVEAADSWEDYKADRVARSSTGWAAYVNELKAREGLGYLHGLLPGKVQATVGTSNLRSENFQSAGAERVPDYQAGDLAGMRARMAEHAQAVLDLARAYRRRQMQAASEAEITAAVKEGKVTPAEALYARRLVTIGAGAADRYARTTAKAIGFSLLRTLRSVGIGMVGGNMFTVDANGDAYVEQRHVILRQRALDELERKLPMTRQLIELTEAQAREHYGLPAGEAKPQMRADTEALAEAERVAAAQAEAKPEESAPNATKVERPDNRVRGGLSPSGLTREEYLAMTPGIPADAGKAQTVATGAEDVEDRMADAADKYLDKAEKAKAREDARAAKEAAKRPALTKLLKLVPNASTGDTTKNNVLQALLRSPLPMPPKADRKGHGEWDWMETSPIFTEKLNFWWRSKLFRVERSISKGDLEGNLAEMAKDGHFPNVGEQPTGQDLSDAIMTALGQLEAVRRGDPVTAKAVDDERMAEDEARTVRFERDTETGPIAVEPGSLRVGEVLVVKDEAGEPHRLVVQGMETVPVDAADYDPASNPLQFVQDGQPVELVGVQVKDGPTYGLQTIAPDRVIYVDGFGEDERPMLAAGGRTGERDEARERALKVYQGLVKLEREGKRLTRAQQSAKEQAERMLGQEFMPFAKAYAPRETLTLDDETRMRNDEGPQAEQLALFAGNRTGKDGFYSKLEQVIDTRMPGAADVATIKGIVANGGLKAEEVKWIGLLPWLESQPGKVSKQAVLDYLRTEGAVRFEEVRMGDVANLDSKVRQKHQITDYAWQQMPEYARQSWRNEFLSSSNQIEPKYGQYQLPGGENYREVVVAMPVKASEADIIVEQRDDPLNGNPWVAWAKTSTGQKAHQLAIGLNEQQVKQQALGNLTSSMGSSYTSSHFPDVPNYLAHYRANDRVDAEGRPGMFLEELQSDRHQEGREKGYRGDVSDDTLAQMESEHRRLNGLLRGSFDEIKNAGGYALLNSQRLELADKIIAARDAKTGGIPDAPYRTTWPLMLFKRALAEAVATKKEWIGWTTGDTQAERYDLSKQVDKIEVYPLEKSPGMVAITAYKNGAQAIRQDVARGSMSDLIGKEAAQKAEQQLEADNFASLEGDGLKVGGEGMKGFYDAILPKEIGKYVKQWGAGVVKGGLQTRSRNDNIQWEVVPATGGRFELRNINTGEIYRDATGRSPYFDVRNNATLKAGELNRAAREIITNPIWRVDITPAMKAGVEAGQALFAGNRTGRDEDQMDLFADSKVGRELPPARLDMWKWASDGGGKALPADLPGLETTGLELFDDGARDRYTAPRHDLFASPSVEPDRERATAGDGGGTGGVPTERGATGEAGRPVDEGGDAGGDVADGGALSADVPAAPAGKGRRGGVRGAAPGSAGGAAGDAERGGGDLFDGGGLSPDGGRAGDVDEGLTIAGGAGPLVEGGAGGDAGVEPAKPEEVKGWRSPLAPEQAGDVEFMRRRLYDRGHQGVLLTNGTGTGKTFSGLGMVKHALENGAQHILVVAPSDKVVSTWVSTAQQWFDVGDAAQLASTSDAGAGKRVVATTYANFAQNAALVGRPWDMIVTDESHYLLSNADGAMTNNLEALRALTWHAKGIWKRAEMLHPAETARLAELSAMDSRTRSDAQHAEVDRLRAVLSAERDRLKAQREAMLPGERTKVVMLSATPFAYHFTLDYAEGYLFDHGPEPENRGSYNAGSARDRFYVENFGYRMRYNKLTVPENATATGILERRFAQKLMKEGAMAGRALQVAADYGRQFITVASSLGARIDHLMEVLRSSPRLGVLSKHLALGDYLARRYLLEGLKAREAVARIKEHLKLGRKVVVFHDYKKGDGTNPLATSFAPGAVGQYYDADQMKHIAVPLAQALMELKAKVPEFDQMKRELDGLVRPVELFEREFEQGSVGIFNGSVSPARRKQLVDMFNQSGGAMNVLLIQRASGKEGISLHDTDGRHQRVFMDLGFPSKPTDAIQCEGRIYRFGVLSNAILEYLTSGTNFERWTFAQTIAQRAGTAENLAMGERARALMQSFATAYNEAEAVAPHAGQGTGGKAADRARDMGDPYDNAVALYYTNQKKTSRNKAAEGVDYYATPEPLGYKMVEWADIRPGDKVLEPSAGHGAIARFFPDSTNRHAVEPSNELAGRLALNATDTVIHQQGFEDYHIGNKFDAVVMNPPFGTAGKTAMEHLIKATGHLREGGRVVALIPAGSSMSQRFDRWYYEDGDAQNFVLRAEVTLPGVTFERAGTGVFTRVVVLDKMTPENRKEGRVPHESARRVELTGEDDVKAFFDRLKDVTLPPRPEWQADREDASTEQELGNVESAGRPVMDTIPAPSAESTWSPAQTKHSKTGADLYVARIMRRLDTVEYATAKEAAKLLGGWYSSYKADGAIPGFQFKSAEARDAFIGARESTGGDERPMLAAGGRTGSVKDSLTVDDDGYLAAVKAGDTAKAQAMVDRAAKAAGYSTGPVYHGTPDSRQLRAVPVFDRTRSVTLVKDAAVAADLQQQLNEEGDKPDHPTKRYFDLLKQVEANRYTEKQPVPVFFADERRVSATYADARRAFDYQGAEPAVLPFYLQLKNPMVIDAGGVGWGKRGGPRTQEEQIQQARAAGHDGMIIRRTRDTYNATDKGPVHTVYVTFNPEQIKSADAVTRDDEGNVIPLSQRFNEASPSILYAANRTGVDELAHEAATSPRNGLAEPTEAQKKAGNYKMGHVRIGGLELSIENPEGSVRRGTDAGGKPWAVTMTGHYGYVLDTQGRDGDHVDVFVKPGTPADWSGPVYVVDQKDARTGRFDEHKAIIGVADADEARALYLSNYSPGWQGLGPVTAMPWEAFKRWARSDEAKKKAARTEHPTEWPTDKRVARAEEAAAALRGGDERPALAAGGRTGVDLPGMETVGLDLFNQSKPQDKPATDEQLAAVMARFKADIAPLEDEQKLLREKVAKAKQKFQSTPAEQRINELAREIHERYKQSGAEAAQLEINKRWSAKDKARREADQAAKEKALKNLTESDDLPYYPLADAALESFNWWKGVPATQAPSRWQQRLMDAVSQAMPEGQFISNRELDRKVIPMMGDAFRPQDTGLRNDTEGGVVGYEIYNARKAVESQRQIEARKQTTAQLGGLRVLKNVTIDGVKLATVTLKPGSNANGTLAFEGVDRQGRIYHGWIEPSRVAELTAPPAAKGAVPSDPNQGALFAAPRTGADEPNVLARLGWNHLDRAVSAKVAGLMQGPVDSAGAVVSRWMNEPGVTPELANRTVKLFQSQLFPSTMLPREVQAALRQMKIRAALGGQRAMDLHRALADSPKFSDIAYPKAFVENPMWRERLFDAMEGRVAMSTLPPEMQALGARLRSMLVDLGREAVAAGRMSLETFEGLQGQFMPRFTRDEAEALSGNWLKRFKLGLDDIKQQRSTAWHIVDTSAKDPRTGNFVTVPWDEKGKRWRFRDEAHRNAFYEELVKKEAVRTLQEHGALVRDLTTALPYAIKQKVKAELARLTPAQVDRPAELSAETVRVVKQAVQKMRERYAKEAPYEPDKLIKDPVYAIARYAAQMSHDNATAEFFNTIARNPAYVREAAGTGYVQIPDNPRFGRLAGKYVQESIAQQVTEMVEAPDAALKLYDTVLGWWKTGKTVLNPGTHVRNVLSNIFFGQMAGTNPLNPGNWGYYRDAVKALREGGPALMAAYEHGVLGADFVSAELRQQLRGLLPPAEDVKDDKDILSIGKRIGQVLPEWAKRPVTKGYNHIATLYQVEDEVFKLAAWLKAQHMGMTAEHAAEHVRKWFPYFDKGTSTTIKALGRTVMPFLGFYRESARIFGQGLKERPLALASSLAIPSFLTAMSAMLLGLDRDELDQVKKDMRGKGGKLLGPTPLGDVPLFSILLPMTTSTGALQQFDLSAIHPFADFLGTRVEQGDGKGDWWSNAWRSLLAAGPLGNLIYSQATGRDAFGDRAFVEDNMTTGEKFLARSKSIGTLALPPLTPLVGSNWMTLAQGGERTIDKSLSMRSPVQGVLRAVGGLDVRSANVDIYRVADDWRKANGLPTSEGMEYGSSTPASRARKLLFNLLAQDEPNMKALSNLLKRMDDIGVGIKNPFDLQKVLLYRDPLMIIKGKENQARFRASLTGEERRVLEEAESTYHAIKARAPALIAEARGR